MSEHITTWLGAYLDEELQGARLHQVRNHLQNCPECQMELDQLRGLSALLCETTPVDEFLPTERFIANLTLSLPRQPAAPQTRKAAELVWWLIPAALIAVWFFSQITLRLTSFVTAISNLGLLGDSLAWLSTSSTRQSVWFGLLANSFGASVEFLAFINRIDLFLRALSAQFLWQAVLGLIYLAWLARWWFGSQNREASPVSNV